MTSKSFKTLALTAALALAPLAAHAGLTTLTTADGWPPVGSSGLGGVQFATAQGGGVKVAMGAHPYINGATMPNDGERTFYAPSGLSNPTRANWSFDFVYDISGCTGCKVFLGIDTDPTAGVNLVDIDLATLGVTSATYAESWNLEMTFIAPVWGYDFNPFNPSSTDFRLYVLDATGGRLASTDITVTVPEPATLALTGLALAGLGLTRRRRA